MKRLAKKKAEGEEGRYRRESRGRKGLGSERLERSARPEPSWKDSFKRGHCDAFALALSRASGWQLGIYQMGFQVGRTVPKLIAESVGAVNWQNVHAVCLPGLKKEAGPLGREIKEDSDDTPVAVADVEGVRKNEEVADALGAPMAAPGDLLRTRLVVASEKEVYYGFSMFDGVYESMLEEAARRIEEDEEEVWARAFSEYGRRKQGEEKQA